MMLQQVIELERILIEEQELYTEIYRLEEEKSLSIRERDGKTINSLSLAQERCIKSLEKLDVRREKVIDLYIRENRLTDLRDTITLSDVLASMDEDSSSHLSRIGLELKNILLKLERLQDTNRHMLQDNLRFFDLLVSGLRSSNGIGGAYGKNGREEERRISSLLINQTA